MKAKRPHFDLKLTLEKVGLVCNTAVEQTPHDQEVMGPDTGLFSLLFLLLSQ